MKRLADRGGFRRSRMTTESRPQVPFKLTLSGANYDAFYCDEPEFLLEGGAGTGKTMTLLARMVSHAQQHPKYQGLILRKEMVNLGRTALRTLEDSVFRGWDRISKSSALDRVHYYGGSTEEPAAYVFDNGSRIVVGGMDESRKVLGTDYDEIYANEITELTLEDWETLSGRLRHDVMPKRSMFGDCNPSFDRHWVLQRALSGKMRRFKTILRDNPAYYNDDGTTTKLGEEYLARLKAMTGTRYQRFYLGQWVGMENAIYADLMDEERQLVSLPENVRFGGMGARGIDYGREHRSAITTATWGSDGHLWVRACWAENGGDPEKIREMDRRHRAAYGVRYGITDPLQEYLARDLGYKAAKGSSGSRKMRIEMVRGLLSADTLRFDQNGPGVRELWEEMEMYRYDVRETPNSIEEIVHRVDDDRVASLEYMAECWDRYGPSVPQPRTPAIEFAEVRRRRYARLETQDAGYNHPYVRG